MPRFSVFALMLGVHLIVRSRGTNTVKSALYSRALSSHSLVHFLIPFKSRGILYAGLFFYDKTLYIR